MNKDYLPFYESLKDDDKEFWLNCSKEELIDHIVSNVRNGETLLSRINKAIEYIEKNKAKLPQRRDDFTCEIVYSDEVVLANGLLRILKGRENSE